MKPVNIFNDKIEIVSMLNAKEVFSVIDHNLDCLEVKQELLDKVIHTTQQENEEDNLLENLEIFCEVAESLNRIAFKIKSLGYDLLDKVVEMNTEREE